MPVNDTLVEVVTFTEQGLDAITARMKAYAAQVDAATKYSKVLTDLLIDPAFARHAQVMQVITNQTQAQTLAIRNQQYQLQTASAYYTRHTQIVTNLNRQYDVMQAKARNAALAADLKTGNIGKHAADMAALNKQYEDLGKQAKLQELVAVHGRLGGVLKANEASVSHFKSVLLGGYIGGVALTAGLMHSGFSGTVEAYRLEQSWTRLSRQIAAIAIPALEKVSQIVGGIAGWFERLTERQQNWALGIGLAVIAAGPLVKIFGTLWTLAKGVRDFMLAWRAAGLVSGLSAGAAALAGTATAATAATAAGATAAGAAAGGAGAAGTAAAAAGGGLLARGSRFALRAALPVAAGVALAEASGNRLNAREGVGDYFGRQLSEGRSYLGAASAVVGQGFAQVGHLLGITKEEFVEDETKKKHRDVSLNQTGISSLGEHAQLIQEEVLKATAARDEAGETWGAKGVQIAEQIRDALLAGALKIPAPPMATS